jgi:hypothetical protein
MFLLHLSFVKCFSADGNSRNADAWGPGSSPDLVVEGVFFMDLFVEMATSTFR